MLRHGVLPQELSKVVKEATPSQIMRHPRVVVVVDIIITVNRGIPTVIVKAVIRQ